MGDLRATAVSCQARWCSRPPYNDMHIMAAPFLQVAAVAHWQAMQKDSSSFDQEANGLDKSSWVGDTALHQLTLLSPFFFFFFSARLLTTRMVRSKNQHHGSFDRHRTRSSPGVPTCTSLPRFALQNFGQSVLKNVLGRGIFFAATEQNKPYTTELQFFCSSRCWMCFQAQAHGPPMVLLGNQ